MTGNRIVDSVEIGQLLERLRISVPSSIMESERTLQERDRILAEAEGEGKRIIAQARQRANEILSADSLVAMARKEYERIVEDGRSAARQRTEEADAYTAQVLEELAATLDRLTTQVDNGLQVMRNRRQNALRDTTPIVAPQVQAQPAPRNGPLTGNKGHAQQPAQQGVQQPAQQPAQPAQPPVQPPVQPPLG